MQTQQEIIGPKEALSYLETNKSNRRLRSGIVDKFAGMIKRNAWQETHQGIAFDEDGVLLDGQHRLAAIVKSGMAVAINVTRGLPRETFHVIDVGLRRSISDLTKDDPAVGQIYTSIARLLLRRSDITFDMAIDVKSNIGCIAEDLISYAPTSVRVFSSAPVKVAAVLRMIEGSNTEYVKDFYRALTLVDLKKLPPIGTALNRQILQGKATTRNAADMMARMWTCFDYNKRNYEKIQIVDPQVNIEEMRKAYIDNYGHHAWIPRQSMKINQ